MRVALYVRVSTERQQQAQTIEQQVAQPTPSSQPTPEWTLAEEHIFRDEVLGAGEVAPAKGLA